MLQAGVADVNGGAEGWFRPRECPDERRRLKVAGQADGVDFPGRGESFPVVPLTDPLASSGPPEPWPTRVLP